MENKSVRVIQTNEEFKVFADQFRMKIIDIYIEQDKPLTVKMVADLMNEVPAKVHYHVKKLLKVNFLELDHIEIINGINAKYYVLKDTNFRIAIKENTSPKMKDFQIDATVSVLCKNLTSFKTDIIDLAEDVRTDGTFAKDDGYISYRKIYLTEEELFAFKEVVDTFIEEHKHLKEGKKKFAIINGVIKKKESSNH